MGLSDLIIPAWLRTAVCVSVVLAAFILGSCAGGWVSDKHHAGQLSDAKRVMAEMQSAVDRAAADQSTRTVAVVIKQAQKTGKAENEITSRRAAVRAAVRVPVATDAPSCVSLPAATDPAAVPDAAASEPVPDTRSDAAQDALTVLEWQAWYESMREANGNP